MKKVNVRRLRMIESHVHANEYMYYPIVNLYVIMLTECDGHTVSYCMENTGAIAARNKKKIATRACTYMRAIALTPLTQQNPDTFIIPIEPEVYMP